MRSLRVLVFLLAAAAGLARAGDPEVPDPPVPHEPESLSPREWNLGAGEERVVLHL
ncbi:MAG: hypothetical protein FJ098_15900, partial [Deltaproteobacteria bacterium]|nr:hypothetical protein [Deltaproteobacteria bacterium]